MLTQAKASEIVALLIVTFISFSANLPDHLLSHVVDRKLLLIALTVSVVIVLLQHLRLMLFIMIAVLAIGANLPEDLASVLGISQLSMVASLGFLVSISLLNYGFNVLPIEVEKQKLDTLDSRQAVLIAVTKGDLVNLHRLLTINVEINFVQDGAMPIFIAAENGYADVMQILIHHGAKFRLQNEEGKTPMDIALSKGYTRTAEIIHHASEANLKNHAKR
jgi:energy-coupling factor transporter transmembrane protein EcfT